MSKRYSGKSFKDSSVMKKPKFSFKEKRKLNKEKRKKKWIYESLGFFLTLESLNDLPLYLFDI